MAEQLDCPKIGIIGCGVIGRKRAASLRDAHLVYAHDLDPSRAAELAATVPGCKVALETRQIFEDDSVDGIIVATLNSALAPLTMAAVRSGKHVLVEKPGAVNSAQLRAIQATAAITGAKVRLGYNHRYHPALIKTRELLNADAIGSVMFIRGRYGHGGRRGYDREWRADVSLSGGGELIDQGVHLIDLSSWILGEFSSVEGHASTLFWDMKVDDNAFLSLRTANGQTAWLHVSCTEWKNLFSLEIYGRHGKLAVDGLGGSYGVERLAHYKMHPEMGPPETIIYEYPGIDKSWLLETTEFLTDILTDRVPAPGLLEGIQTLEIVETIYRQSGYPVSAAGL